MNNLTIPCNGEHTPSFSIKFKISPIEYHVCNDCAKLTRFSRGIENKIPVSEIIGQGRPQTISEMEVTNDK